MRRFISLAGSAVVLAALGLPRGFATSCSVAPACAHLGEGRVVFVGHVIESGLGDDSTGNIQRPVRLKVREALVGLDDGVQEVELQAVWPEPGALLLVYASRGDDGKLYLGWCNGTRPVNDVPEDLKYLRRLRDGKKKASFSGYIDSGTLSNPIAGVTVTITAEDGTSNATLSDHGGEFTFQGLAPGRYDVRMEKEGYVPSSRNSFRPQITLAPGQCGWDRADFHRDGEVSGVVTNTDGTPVLGVTVELLSIKPDGSPLYSEREARTSADGRFLLTGVEPGSYLLGVNVSEFRKDSPYFLTLYPGVVDHLSAAVLTVDDRQKLDTGELRLPERLEGVEITVRVTWPDGTPAQRTIVKFRGADKEGKRSFSFDSAPTDADGRVAVTVFPDASLTATARVVMGEYQGQKYLFWQSGEVKIQPDAKILQLILTGPPPPAGRPRTRLRDYLRSIGGGTELPQR